MNWNRVDYKAVDSKATRSRAVLALVTSASRGAVKDGKESGGPLGASAAIRSDRLFCTAERLGRYRSLRCSCPAFHFSVSVERWLASKESVRSAAGTPARRSTGQRPGTHCRISSISV